MSDLMAASAEGQPATIVTPMPKHSRILRNEAVFRFIARL